MKDLPSQASAYDLVQRGPGALPAVIGCTAFRAGLIAAGLYAAGDRKNVLRHALGGAIVVEAFVLLWCLAHRGEA